jgi:dTDP-4-dehydrorhamnose 3,5-epimerase
MKHSMEVNPGEISGLLFFDMNLYQDKRGFFTRNFCSTTISKMGGFGGVSQANLSYNTSAGTIRGFHFQVNGSEEAKTVTVLKGSLHYKVIDLRKTSQTYLKYTSFKITAINQVVQVPKGCAPGFQTLENETLLHYYVSNSYSQENEAGIRYNDPYFNFRWPLENITVSDRDSNFPDFNSKNFKGLNSF